MPIKKSSENELKLSSGNLICIDEEDLWIQGNNNSDNGRMLSVDFVRCTESSTGSCASSETIQSWSRKKYISVLNNRIRFDQSKFGEESIVQDSVLSWINISTRV